MRSQRPYRWAQLSLVRVGLTLAVACLIAVLLVGGGLLVYGLRYDGLLASPLADPTARVFDERRAGLIYEGVSIQGVPVGGLTRAQALERVAAQVAVDGHAYVTLFTADREWTVSTLALGGRWLLDQAVDDAWSLGRSGVFHQDMVARVRLLWLSYNLIPEFALEPGAALGYLRPISGQVAHPTRRAYLRVAGLQAEAGSAEAGREMDIAATRAAIEAAVRGSIPASGWGATPRLAYMRLAKQPRARGIPLEPLRVPLVFREIVPPLTEVEGARESVAAILSGPLTLAYDFPELDAQGHVVSRPRRWDVDQAVLATWLTVGRVAAAEGHALSVDVDRERMRAYLARLVDEIARPAREGRYAYDPAADALSVVYPGQIGYALDLDALVAVVAEACLAGERAVTLPVVVLPPRVSRADLEALRPLALISTGETSFSGSTADRLQNIKVSTARFQGVTVAPGATFSFLEHLGLVTQANGYANAWVIFGDRTVLGPGGGVCQVSTTAFRAAFWGGYPIVERRPHAYRVSWYEPPLGLDAAVFSPVADMRFQNDTDTPILILTEVDEGAAKLYFRFYGRATGRTVRMEGPVTENPVPAPEAVSEEDPTLAAGQRVQVDWPKDGLDVRIYRIIERKGAPTVRQEFFSRYQAWPARFRVGPSS